MDQKHKNILIDLLFLLSSIIVAIWLGTSHILENFLVTTSESMFFGSLFGGLLFTSIFTTAPAIVVLGEISQNSSPWLVAFIGAFGALLGDLIMFKFLKDRLAKDFYSLFHINLKEINYFHIPRFRWVIVLIGALIIASPFPDELGLAVLGFSNTETRWVIPISFTFNFLGILAISTILF